MILLLKFGETDGVHHVQHPPAHSLEYQSPLHAQDFDSGADIEANVQPEDLGTYQDLLKDWLVTKWTGVKSTQFWHYNRFAAIVFCCSKWLKLYHRTFLVAAYRLFVKLTLEKNLKLVNLHLLPKLMREQLVLLAPQRRFMVARTDKSYLSA